MLGNHELILINELDHAPMGKRVEGPLDNFAEISVADDDRVRAAGRVPLEAPDDLEGRPHARLLPPRLLCPHILPSTRALPVHCSALLCALLWGTLRPIGLPCLLVACFCC